MQAGCNPNVYRKPAGTRTDKASRLPRRRRAACHRNAMTAQRFYARPMGGRCERRETCELRLRSAPVSRTSRNTLDRVGPSPRR